MPTWYPPQIGSVDVAVFGDDDGAAVDGTAEVGVAVFGDDDGDAAVGGAAEVGDFAVGNVDDAVAAVDETLGLACTCVDDAGSAVEELDTAVGNQHMSRIDGCGGYRTD